MVDNKCVIAAGGLGTRITEETLFKPKPMVEIGGFPILWHIMKIYSFYGFNEFVIALGYKGEIIKDYFLNYYDRYSDLTVDFKNDKVLISERQIIIFEQSAKVIQNIEELLQKNIGMDVVASHMHELINLFDECLGKFSNEQVLDSIFSSFCVGK